MKSVGCSFIIFMNALLKRSSLISRFIGPPRDVTWLLFPSSKVGTSNSPDAVGVGTAGDVGLVATPTPCVTVDDMMVPKGTTVAVAGNVDVTKPPGQVEDVGEGVVVIFTVIVLKIALVVVIIRELDGSESALSEGVGDGSEPSPTVPSSPGGNGTSSRIATACRFNVSGEANTRPEYPSTYILNLLEVQHLGTTYK
jgi:hypothetical protein